MWVYYSIFIIPPAWANWLLISVQGISRTREWGERKISPTLFHFIHFKIDVFYPQGEWVGKVLYVMLISSSCLFHFTPRLTNLKNIINNGFCPKYCIEKYWGVDFAIPMVCFCDIPLSLIHNHVHTYGSYAIGIHKKWTERINILPVHYLPTGKAQNSIRYKLRKAKDGFSPISLEFYNQLCFIKKTTGQHEKNGNNNRSYKFYDEREWRYVPETKNVKNLVQIGVDQSEISILNNKESFDYLKVNPDDISFLIVRDEQDRTKLIKFIMDHFCKAKSTETAYILISKILTIQQIKENI